MVQKTTKGVSTKDSKTATAEAVKGAAPKDSSGTAANIAVKDTPNTALAVINYEEDAGAGLEGADKDSFAIPFLVVLQPLSPQIETVEGAKAGMLCNTVTNELFDEIEVVPVGFQRRFNRWVPRDAGGGYKGEMSVAEVEGLLANPQSGAKEIPSGEQNAGAIAFEGDILKDTRNHFVMLLSKDRLTASPAVISCTSTMIKCSKRWLAAIKSVTMPGPGGKPFNPASYSQIYKVTSEKKENSKGKWSVFVIDPVGPVSDPSMYAAAKAFHGQVMAGQVKVSAPMDDVVEGSDEDGIDPNKKF